MGDTERTRKYRIMDIVIPIVAGIILSLIGIVWGSTAGQIRDLEKKSDILTKETAELKAHREDDSKMLQMILDEVKYIRVKVDGTGPYRVEGRR